MAEKQTMIIGGTSGLGRESARLLAAEGHAITIVGSRSAVDLKDADLPYRYLKADLADESQLVQFVSHVSESLPHINNLIFVQRYRGKNDPWVGELETSISATKTIIEALSDRFAPGGNNSIVLVSSVYGAFIGDTQPVGYHVAKAALEQMVKFYAVTLGKKDIRVNGVCPCTFQKEESRDYYLSDKQLLDLYSKITPLGRMGTALDVAQVISFLCSAKASFVTGQNIVVDGGVSLLGQESLARSLMSV